MHKDKKIGEETSPVKFWVLESRWTMVTDRRPEKAEPYVSNGKARNHLISITEKPKGLGSGYTRFP